jgi:hypothetical protein
MAQHGCPTARLPLFGNGPVTRRHAHTLLKNPRHTARLIRIIANINKYINDNIRCLCQINKAHNSTIYPSRESHALSHCLIIAYLFIKDSVGMNSGANIWIECFFERI